MKIRLAASMALSLATLLGTTSLFAQGSSSVHRWLEDSFVMSLGGLLPDKEFNIRMFRRPAVKSLLG